MADIVTYPLGTKHSTTISRCDQGKITDRIRQVFNYAYMGSIPLHSIIIGPRPEDVPEDWVIDHIDRNKLNNVCSNLRWVSHVFNCWNVVRADAGEQASRFRGVTRNPPSRGGKAWCAGGHKSTDAGAYDTEREAAIASATSYIRTFGIWAETSDILFTEDQTLPGALLSLEELAEIKRSIIATDALEPIPLSVTKGTGVIANRNGFEAWLGRKYLKKFKTLDAVVAFRKECIASLLEKEWQEYLLITPPRDADGDVAIALSDGKHGTGLMSKVDAQYWHQLTFKAKWAVNVQGYVRANSGVRYKSGFLHKAVMLLVDHTYVSGRDASIDHIKPAAKLDNRAENLRVVTHAEQMRNKVKRPGGTSPYMGVCRKGSRWAGKFRYTTSAGRQCYHVTRMTQEEVVLALNAKRLEVHGKKAVLDPLIIT